MADDASVADTKPLAPSGTSLIPSTPGPWHVKPEEHLAAPFTIRDAQGAILAEVQHDVADPQVDGAEAAARLMAAAPDLLVTVKELRNVCAAALRVVDAQGLNTPLVVAMFGDGLTSGFGARADAALAKAEGR